MIKLFRVELKNATLANSIDPSIKNDHKDCMINTTLRDTATCMKLNMIH